MLKLIARSFLALAATSAATGLYAEEVQHNDKKFSIEFREIERKENKAHLERVTNRASAYLVLGKDLYRDIDAVGVAIDAKASLDTLKFNENAFGKFHDNIYFAAGMRHFSGDGNQYVASFKQENDVTYFSLMSSIGFMRDIINDSSGFGNHFNGQAYVGVGLGYSSFERKRVFIGQKRTYDDAGIHITYNTGFIMGINKVPELEMELGFQSLGKGGMNHEFFFRADYNLKDIIGMPISASTRLDFSDNALALGATYQF